MWLAGLVVLWLLGCVVAAFWMGALVVTGCLTALWYAGCAWDAYRTPRAPQTLRSWLELVGAVVVAWMIAPVLVGMLIRGFTMEAFKVASGSMCPTLDVGDQLFVDKTAYRGEAPARGDVVLYQGSTIGGAKAEFLHRVVAIGGDEVAVEDNRVTVNGEAAQTTKLGESGCDGESLRGEARHHPPHRGGPEGDGGQAHAATSAGRPRILAGGQPLERGR